MDRLAGGSARGGDDRLVVFLRRGARLRDRYLHRHFVLVLLFIQADRRDDGSLFDIHNAETVGKKEHGAKHDHDNE